MKTIYKLLLILLPIPSYGQEAVPGSSFVNVGVGLSGWGIPLSADYEFPIAENSTISIKGSAQRFRESYGYLNGSYEYRHSIYGIGGSYNYYLDEHFEEFIPKTADIHVSAEFMYYIWQTKWKNPVNGVSDVYRGRGGGNLGFSLLAGGRFHLPKNEKIAIHFLGGIGSAWSVLRLGVSFNL